LSASWRHAAISVPPSTSNSTVEKSAVQARVSALKEDYLAFPSDTTTCNDSVVVLPVRISQLVTFLQTHIEAFIMILMPESQFFHGLDVL
jgi:hypothetical protein